MEHPFRVVDYIVDFLGRHGVEHFFGVGGANIEDLYDAAEASPMPPRGVLAKHEFSAATMADGYHRAAQRLAVAVSTSGPGAMNLVPGVAEMRASQVPALVLIGQPPTALDGQGSFQETSGRAGTMDAERLFREISVYCARLDHAEDVTRVLPDAYVAANHPVTGGPAVLLLPKDVQQTAIPPWPTPDPDATAADLARLGPTPAGERLRDHAARVLCEAREREGVAIIAGEGVARTDSRDELAALARALDAPVAAVPDARDVYVSPAPPATGPPELGPLGAFVRHGVRERLERASAVLLAGTRLPQVADAGLRDHLKGVPVVCVDPRESYLATHEDLLQLPGPVRTELRLLTEALARREPGGEPASTAPATTTAPTAPAPGVAPSGAHQAADAGPLDLTTMARTVSEALPPGVTVVTDAGNAGTACIRSIDVPGDGGRFITAMGMGGMGYSFGAGVGAAFATGRRSYVLAGDGSFLMHGLELHTAVEHRLPVTVVLFNNNSHAMCHTREQLYYSGEYTYNVFRDTRLGDGVAAMFPGLDAVTVRGAAELREALLRTHASDAPSLICVDIDHTEVPPFGPFLAHLESAGRRPTGRTTEEGDHR